MALMDDGGGVVAAGGAPEAALLLRQEQARRLRGLIDSLLEALLDEADPAGWPGAGKTAVELDAAERGGRDWCKKNLAATFALVSKGHALLAVLERGEAGGEPEDEPGLAVAVALAEQRAAGLVQRLGLVAAGGGAGD